MKHINPSPPRTAPSVQKSQQPISWNGEAGANHQTTQAGFSPITSLIGNEMKYSNYLLTAGKRSRCRLLSFFLRHSGVKWTGLTLLERPGGLRGKRLCRTTSFRSAAGSHAGRCLKTGASPPAGLSGLSSSLRTPCLLSAACRRGVRSAHSFLPIRNGSLPWRRLVDS